jgi:hypothetical protein
MPHFRAVLAAGDARPITADIVREVCRDVTRPANLFLAPPLRAEPAVLAAEETFWEIFNGRLLDGTQTRERRRFQTWGVTLFDGIGEPPREPTLAVRFDADAGTVFVTRAILCRAHESYDAGGNVILTREIQKWQREFVGTIHLHQLVNAGELRDELACLLFQAVVGTGRLPLTSVEAPLPSFAFGQVGYFFTPGAAAPITSWRGLSRLPAEVSLAESELVKHLELLLRATPADELTAVAARSLDSDLPLLRSVFNDVSLSPYTDFVPKCIAFVRHLVRQNSISTAEQVDFLGHLIRQLARHLVAYDLITFHHRGANFPDALLLDDVLTELLPLTAERPDLFIGDEPASTSRRRAVRQGLLLRLEYAGHLVPDAPTSPGENLRVLPAPFVRVPEDQIYSPVTRRRRLFVDERLPELAMIRSCFRDLDSAAELRELGTALFLDRPLGFAKAPGEPDQTLLMSHVLFSRSIAEQRLARVARRWDWLPDDGSINRWREQLRAMKVDGRRLEYGGPPSRPGVVSLQDAFRIADDWLVLRTTRQTIRDFHDQYDLGDIDLPVREWRLLLPGGTDAAPKLCVYDGELRLRMELAADLSRGYTTRAGVERPTAGVRVTPPG